MVGREGLEPPEPVKATDLQSVPLPITVYLPSLGLASSNLPQLGDAFNQVWPTYPKSGDTTSISHPFLWVMMRTYPVSHD